jgi:hypothetical protein
MIDHILDFANEKNPKFANPKDSLPWPKKDKPSFNIQNNRYITKKFLLNQPKKTPEDQWKQQKL